MRCSGKRTSKRNQEGQDVADIFKLTTDNRQLKLSCYTSPMRVLGIDCGTEYTGYGVVDLISDSRNSDRLVCIICGAIKVSPRDPMPTRLSRISIGLQELISQHQPERVAIEDVFYATNVKSALKARPGARRRHAGRRVRRTRSRRILAALHQVGGGRIRPGRETSGAANGGAPSEPRPNSRTRRRRRCARHRHLPSPHRRHH